MKFLILLTIVSVAIAQEYYDTKHDDFDIESLVANEAGLKAYTDCFTDAGPCDEIMAHFKKTLADAVTLACSKCTDAQKNIMLRYVTELQKKLPESFSQFKNKFDPEDKYFGPLTVALTKA